MKAFNKTLLDIEASGSRVKSLIVKIGGSFRLNRPNHEYTKDFAEIEEYFYVTHEDLLFLLAENQRLREKLASAFAPNDEGYETTTEQVEIKPPKTISDDEYEQSNRILMQGAKKHDAPF